MFSKGEHYKLQKGKPGIVSRGKMQNKLSYRMLNVEDVHFKCHHGPTQKGLGKIELLFMARLSKEVEGQHTESNFQRGNSPRASGKLSPGMAIRMNDYVWTSATCREVQENLQGFTFDFANDNELYLKTVSIDLDTELNQGF